jgi:hypothetical protein
MQTQGVEVTERDLKTMEMMKVHKLVGLSLSIVFAIVGLIFLSMPDRLLIFLNTVSRSFGMSEAPVQAFGFYQILAVGYMYVVTLLAYLMYLHPENGHFLWLLINGKSASSIISLLFFFLHRHYLVYLTNGIVDGVIAVGLMILYRRMKGTPG